MAKYIVHSLVGRGGKSNVGLRKDHVNRLESSWRKQYSESGFYKTMVVVGSDLSDFPNGFNVTYMFLKIVWYFDT